MRRAGERDRRRQLNRENKRLSNRGKATVLAAPDGSAATRMTMLAPGARLPAEYVTKSTRRRRSAQVMPVGLAVLRTAAQTE
jgi:hypothetical protein